MRGFGITNRQGATFVMPARVLFGYRPVFPVADTSSIDRCRQRAARWFSFHTPKNMATKNKSSTSIVIQLVGRGGANTHARLSAT